MSELKPCPFCGGEAKISAENFGAKYFVRCINIKNCLVRPFTISYSTEEEAVNAWNRRVE